MAACARAAARGGEGDGPAARSARFSSAAEAGVVSDPLQSETGTLHGPPRSQQPRNLL